jgi:hypothetical protein
MIINLTSLIRDVKRSLVTHFNNVLDKPAYFLGQTIHPKTISLDVIKKLKNNEIYLIADSSEEAFRAFIDRLFEVLIYKHQISPNNVIVVANSSEIIGYANSISASHNLDKFKFIQFNWFEESIRRMLTEDFPDGYQNDYTTQKFLKSYVNLNHAWRTHRIALIALLHSHDLLKYGHNSFKHPPSLNLDKNLYKNTTLHPYLKIAKIPAVLDEYNWVNNDPEGKLNDIWKIYFEEACETYYDIENELKKGYDVLDKLPLTLDTKHPRPNFNSFSYPTNSLFSIHNYYRTSMIGVVTETYYGNDKFQGFITEKTWKCIAFKRPFIVISNAYFLKTLRSYGYKTFDGLIDESYDTELDVSKRLLKALNEIKRICEFNSDQIKEFITQANDIVEYNYNHLMTRQYDYTFI